MTLGTAAPQETPESQESNEQLKCPHCGSPRWSCWDERVEAHRDKDTGDEYDFPVGYMKCLDCQKTYIDEPFPDENIQDEIDAQDRY